MRYPILFACLFFAVVFVSAEEIFIGFRPLFVTEEEDKNFQHFREKVARLPDEDKIEALPDAIVAEPWVESMLEQQLRLKCPDIKVSLNLEHRYVALAMLREIVCWNCKVSFKSVSPRYALQAKVALRFWIFDVQEQKEILPKTMVYGSAVCACERDPEQEEPKDLQARIYALLRQALVDGSEHAAMEIAQRFLSPEQWQEGKTKFSAHLFDSEKIRRQSKTQQLFQQQIVKLANARLELAKIWQEALMPSLPERYGAMLGEPLPLRNITLQADINKTNFVSQEPIVVSFQFNEPAFAFAYILNVLADGQMQMLFPIVEYENSQVKANLRHNPFEQKSFPVSIIADKPGTELFWVVVSEKRIDAFEKAITSATTLAEKRKRAGQDYDYPIPLDKTDMESAKDQLKNIRWGMKIWEIKVK